MPKEYTLTGPMGHIVARGAGLSVDVVEAVTSAGLSFGVSETTQLALTIDDRRLEALGTGLFDPGTATVPGSQLDYGSTVLECRAIELSPTGALTVTARAFGVCELKRPKPPRVTAGLSPSQWVRTEAKAVGLTPVVQDTPSANTVTLNKDENRWDTMQRLAKEVGFVCFEADGTLFFGKPSWLITRKGVRVVNVALGGDRQPLDGRVLARPHVRRSGDNPGRVAELSVEVLPELGALVRPGDALVLAGLPFYSGRYLVDGVDVDLSDSGTVTVNASTPVDPTPEPPQAAGAGGASGTGDVRSPGAGTYAGVRLNAEQVAGATKIVQAAKKLGAPRDAIIIALMVAAVEAEFLSPDEAHSDRDSAGPFQQRRAWRRSEAQRRDYAIATGLFLNGGDGGQRGLLDVKNWKNRPKGVVAQVVQGSAFPSRYAPKEKLARALLDAIEKTATSVVGSSTITPASGSKLEQFVQLARRQAGKRYLQTRSISYGRGTNPRVFDCSSLVYWAAVNAGFNLPSSALNTRTQSAYATKHGLWIPLDRGLRTRGAILWKSGHTAISLGNGRTIEAMGTKYGVLEANARGRFTRAWMLPGA